MDNGIFHHIYIADTCLSREVVTPFSVVIGFILIVVSAIGPLLVFLLGCLGLLVSSEIRQSCMRLRDRQSSLSKTLR